MTFTFTIKLPVADDELGRWMDEHGASVTFQCMLGQYHVHVEWCRVISHSDKFGTRKETFLVSRYGPSLPEAMTDAIRAAMEREATRVKP